MSEELFCGEVAGAPKLVPFSFSFFLLRFHGNEKISRWNFGHENDNEKEIRFRFRNLAKKLAQDAKFCVTETNFFFVSGSCSPRTKTETNRVLSPGGCILFSFPFFSALCAPARKRKQIS